MPTQTTEMSQLEHDIRQMELFPNGTAARIALRAASDISAAERARLWALIDTLYLVGKHSPRRSPSPRQPQRRTLSPHTPPVQPQVVLNSTTPTIPDLAKPQADLPDVHASLATIETCMLMIKALGERLEQQQHAVPFKAAVTLRGIGVLDICLEGLAGDHAACLREIRELLCAQEPVAPKEKAPPPPEQQPFKLVSPTSPTMPSRQEMP